MVLGISHAVVMIARGAECSRMHLFHEAGLAVTVGINLCGKWSEESSQRRAGKELTRVELLHERRLLVTYLVLV